METFPKLLNTLEALQRQRGGGGGDKRDGEGTVDDDDGGGGGGVGGGGEEDRGRRVVGVDLLQTEGLAPGNHVVLNHGDDEDAG